MCGRIAEACVSSFKLIELSFVVMIIACVIAIAESIEKFMSLVL